MQTVTFACDRCGEPASGWVRITAHAYQGQMRCGAHDLREMDLCPRCAAELRAWCDNDKEERRDES